MILLVTGGRSFCEKRPGADHMSERIALGFALDYIKPSSVIVGDAGGADRWAKIWCDRRGVPCEVFAADWKRHGKRAGPIRNQEMVDRKPDMGCAMPGGFGTDDCARRMERAGIEIYRVSVK